MTHAADALVSSHFRELTYDECQERLASATMGRVAWSAGSLQHILPVSYAMHVGNVVSAPRPTALWLTSSAPPTSPRPFSGRSVQAPFPD
jgi:hypothetical protein